MVHCRVCSLKKKIEDVPEHMIGKSVDKKMDLNVQSEKQVIKDVQECAIGKTNEDAPKHVRDKQMI